MTRSLSSQQEETFAKLNSIHSILVHQISHLLPSILVLVLGFKMHDWAAPVIAAALFALLAPGLIFQMPGKESAVGFMNMKTSIISMFLHTVLYGLLLILFLVVLDIHMYA
ncbi:hypothetical protein L1887_32022 [Cichorium endivia]|nr:hypothetical protein L1887_32022 [Cichorium endivia]